MASYGTGNVTETSFDFYAHGFSGDTSRYMQVVVSNRVRFSGTINTWQSSPYYGQMTVSGLTSGTTYTIKVYIGTSTVYSNNTLMYTGSVTTEEEQVIEGCILYDYMELVSSSYSNGVVTVRFRIYYYNDGDTSDSATIYYQIGGNGYYNQSVSKSGGGSGYITCNMTISTGALTTTSYTFNVNGYIDSNNCGNDHFSKNLTATWENTRPDKFYWISSSSSLKSGQEISTYITATKWKSLQTNVNEVRVYKGLSNYSFTTYSKGQTITATAYNQIANAINGIKSGTVSTVSKGDKITASVMMALQNGINGIT